MIFIVQVLVLVPSVVLRQFKILMQILCHKVVVEKGYHSKCTHDKNCIHDQLYSFKNKDIIEYSK